MLTTTVWKGNSFFPDERRDVVADDATKWLKADVDLCLS